MLARIPPASPSQNTPEHDAIISVERIWDRAAHNAFTSLIEFDGKMYFRVFPNPLIKLLVNASMEFPKAKPKIKRAIKSTGIGWTFKTVIATISNTIHRIKTAKLVTLLLL
jgi:hypothetical protein